MTFEEMATEGSLSFAQLLIPLLFIFAIASAIMSVPIDISLTLLLLGVVLPFAMGLALSPRTAEVISAISET